MNASLFSFKVTMYIYQIAKNMYSTKQKVGITINSKKNV